MEPNNGLSGAKIALLVDFDNVVLGLEDPGFDIELVVNALRERGTIVLGRVYGDWYRHNRHRRRLMEQGLELVETPAFGPVIKNSADIRIALDGFEIGLTQSHIDTFAIVSGDSDFLPLIKKLQSLGRRVLVICGNRFTSDMLRRNCNEFISYENLLAQSVGATEDATTLEGAFSLLHRAMAALRERGTEIRGSGVKQMMIQLNPVFSERTFGCTQFRQFLQKAVQAGVVKLGPRDKVSGEFYVLLPDEDEAPLQQKIDKRAENRARRDDKIAQIAARIETIPVDDVSVADGDEIGVEVELDATADAVEESDYEVSANGQDDMDGGAVFAEDAFGYDPEPMAKALTESVQEIAQNTIARDELLARGLRPSNRRFSGRNGRPPLQIDETELISDEIDAEAEVPALATESEEATTDTEAEVQSTTEASGDTRRLRTRRRRRSASGQITVVSDEVSVAEGGDNEVASDETTLGPEVEALVPLTVTDENGEPAMAQIETGVTPTALESDSEPPVDGVLPVEAEATAVSEVQAALETLEAAGNVPTPERTEPPTFEVSTDASTSEPTLTSEGVTVEAEAPALPEGAAHLQTADPVGVPAVQVRAIEAEGASAEAPAKPKRRRPSRAKKVVTTEVPIENATLTEAAPTESAQPEPPSIEPGPTASEVLDQSQPAPPVESVSIEVEALPPLTSEPTGGADAELATESTESVDSIGSETPAEAAPAKPKRRRPSRAKKAAPTEGTE